MTLIYRKWKSDKSYKTKDVRPGEYQFEKQASDCVWIVPGTVSPAED